MAELWRLALLLAQNMRGGFLVQLEAELALESFSSYALDD